MKGGLLKEQNRIFKNLALSAIGLIIFIKIFIINPELRTLQNEIDNREIKHVSALFHREFNDMKKLLEDNAIWIDLYQAVEKKDFNFLKRSYNYSSLDILSLSYIGFYDLSLNEMFGVKEKKNLNELNEFLDAKIKNIIDINFFKNSNNMESFIVIEEFNGKKYLCSSHFILDDEKNEVPNGYMLIIKEINDDFIEILAKESGFSIELDHQNKIKLYDDVSSGFNLKGFFLSNNTNYKFYNIPIYGNRNNSFFTVKLRVENLAYKKYKNNFTTDFILILIYLLAIYFTNLRIKSVTRPIIKLNKHMEIINKSGKFSPLRHTNKNNEIDMVIHSFNSMIHMLKKRDGELKNKNSILEEMLYIDTLTGVGSRRLLQDKIPEDFQYAIENQEKISILMIDIDYFKQYNDTYGHIKGDTILMKIGEMLNSKFYDADFIIRYGGEEFMIFLRGESAEKTSDLISNFMAELKNEKIEHSKGVEGIITISVGIYSNIPDKDADLEEYIKIADSALYRAKESGRNKFIFHKN